MAKSENINNTNMSQENNSIKSALNAQMATKSKSKNEQVNRNPVQAIDSVFNQKPIKKTNTVPATAEDIKSLKEILTDYINYTKLNDVTQNKKFSEFFKNFSELVKLVSSDKNKNQIERITDKSDINKLDKTSFENFQRTFKNNDIDTIRLSLSKISDNIVLFDSNISKFNELQNKNFLNNNEVISKYFEEIKTVLTKLSENVAAISIPDIRLSDIENITNSATDTVKNNLTELSKTHIQDTIDITNNILEKHYSKFISTSMAQTGKIVTAINQQDDAIKQYFDKISNQISTLNNSTKPIEEKTNDNFVNSNIKDTIDFNEEQLNKFTTSLNDNSKVIEGLTNQLSLFENNFGKNLENFKLNIKIDKLNNSAKPLEEKTDTLSVNSNIDKGLLNSISINALEAPTEVKPNNKVLSEGEAIKAGKLDAISFKNYLYTFKNNDIHFIRQTLNQILEALPQSSQQSESNENKRPELANTIGLTTEETSNTLEITDSKISKDTETTETLLSEQRNIILDNILDNMTQIGATNEELLQTEKERELNNFLNKDLNNKKETNLNKFLNGQLKSEETKFRTRDKLKEKLGDKKVAGVNIGKAIEEAADLWDFGKGIHRNLISKRGRARTFGRIAKSIKNPKQFAKIWKIGKHARSAKNLGSAAKTGGNLLKIGGNAASKGGGALGKLVPTLSKLGPSLGKLGPTLGNAIGKLGPAIGKLAGPAMLAYTAVDGIMAGFRSQEKHNAAIAEFANKSFGQQLLHTILRPGDVIGMAIRESVEVAKEQKNALAAQQQWQSGTLSKFQSDRVDGNEYATQYKENRQLNSLYKSIDAATASPSNAKTAIGNAMVNDLIKRHNPLNIAEVRKLLNSEENKTIILNAYGFTKENKDKWGEIYKSLSPAEQDIISHLGITQDVISGKTTSKELALKTIGENKYADNIKTITAGASFREIAGESTRQSLTNEKSINAYKELLQNPGDFTKQGKGGGTPKQFFEDLSTVSNFLNGLRELCQYGSTTEQLEFYKSNYNKFLKAKNNLIAAGGEKMNMKNIMDHYGVDAKIIQQLVDKEILNPSMFKNLYTLNLDEHFKNIAEVENQMEQMIGHASTANFFGENTLSDITDAEREADVDITTSRDAVGDVSSVMVNSISNTSDEIVTATIDRESAKNILKNHETIRNNLTSAVGAATAVGDTEAAAAAQKQLDQFNLIVESLKAIAGNKNNNLVRFSMSTEQTHIPGIENLLKRELPKIFG